MNEVELELAVKSIRIFTVSSPLALNRLPVIVAAIEETNVSSDYINTKDVLDKCY